MPRTRSNRCVYKERGVRCRKNGAGDPCLCRAHRIVLENEAERSRAQPGASAARVVVNFMKGRRMSSETIMDGVFDFVGVMFGAQAAANAQRAATARCTRCGGTGVVHTMYPAGMSQAEPCPACRIPPRSRPGSAPPPRSPPIDATKAKLAAAREALGFGPNEPITVEIVKKRHRELAKQFHPDLGKPEEREFRTQKMQRVNAAADELSEALG